LVFSSFIRLSSTPVAPPRQASTTRIPTTTTGIAQPGTLPFGAGDGAGK
jgi:hypothetical protein